MPSFVESASVGGGRAVAIVIVTALASSFGAGRASAQPATAPAEILFREGKRLMAEGNVAAACDAFEGSYARDPAISTLLNLADCREKNQQYASAWAYFLDAARKARGRPDGSAFLEVADKRAIAAEARLSYLIINVPDEARIDGLTITRNGVRVEPVEWNRDMPVDGGAYRIEAKAPAYESWSVTIHVENAKDKESVNVPRFGDASRKVTPLLPAAAVDAAVSPPADDGGRGFDGRRKGAALAWALGAVAIGGGVALEIKSGHTYDDAKAAVDEGRSRELTDSANDQRHLAIAAGAFGVVAVGVGSYLWFSGGKARRDQPSVAVVLDSGHTGLVAFGTF